MKKLIISIFMLLLVSSGVIGATIRGTIYNLNLDKVNGAIVDVNSSPKQRMVSNDGSYSFNLPNGDYTITAVLNERNNVQRTLEKVSVKSEGEYVLDLFLFPDISSEEGLSNETDINITVPYYNNSNTIPFFVVIGVSLLIVILFIIYWLIYKKRNIDKKIISKENKDTDKILLILKKHGGRATQKDIRKEIPLSEAKISLMIAELESEGKVKKIKKGRGNIIVLQ